jgi:hypothetical protein
MPTYEVYQPHDVLRYRVTIHADGHPEWDFSRDESGGFWLGEETRGALVRAIAYYEQHRRPDELSFIFNKAFTVGRVPTP